MSKNNKYEHINVCSVALKAVSIYVLFSFTTFFLASH